MQELNHKKRIVVTADLHYDPSGQLTSPRRIRQLVAQVREENPDAVVIAGDLAHGLSLFRDCLELFDDLSVPIGVIAGNHDVWIDKGGHRSSLDMWNKYLQEATRNAGAIWLEAENMIVVDVAVVGSMVWYDYSAIDPGLNFSTEEIAAAKERLNNDARMIDWPYSDGEFARVLVEELRKRLDAADADPGIREILLVTHVPVFEQQMTRKPDNPTWGLSNAYFGNLTAGNMVLSYSKVRNVVSGHTHVGQQGIVSRITGSPIESCVIPSEYGEPAYVLVEL